MGDLVGGSFRILGDLRDASRPGLCLAHSLVTGELVVLAVADPLGPGPTADELRQEGSVFGEIVSPYVHALVDWNPEVPFIAFEYVSAWPLATALRNTPPAPVSTVLAMMSELASGLAAVHRRGALYRGLHPGRVMVMRDGGTRLATTPDAVLVTRGHARMAPAKNVPVPYLAPEQLDGHVDVRSDLYAVGAVGYELLTGRRLMADLDPITQAVMLQKGAPAVPSSVRSEVPEDVDEFFASLLARDPSDRPASAAELVAQLQELAEGTAAPDALPLAAYLSAQPVVAPLLAEDAAEGVIYAALHESVAPDEPREAPRERRPSVRNAAERAADSEAIEGERQGRLVGPGGEVFALRGPRVIIGRSAGDDVPEVDLTELDTTKVVSREHAVLDLGEGRWYVSELSGRNGTWLNGERVRKGSFLRLRRGDQLRIANIFLSYVVADGENVTDTQDQADTLQAGEHQLADTAEPQ